MRSPRVLVGTMPSLGMLGLVGILPTCGEHCPFGRRQLHTAQVLVALRDLPVELVDIDDNRFDLDQSQTPASLKPVKASDQPKTRN